MLTESRKIPALRTGRVVWKVFRNVRKLTPQNLAELVERIGVDVSIFAQSVKLTGADVVLVDQLILRNIPFFHCIPKPVKSDHAITTIC